MQRSELFRRGIVVPLDQWAEDCLRAGNVTEHLNVRFLHLPDDEVIFLVLWKLGLFMEINARCNSLIDDYEEDLIEPSLLHEVHAAVAAARKLPAAQERSIANFLYETDKLVGEAILRSRPMVFVL